MTSRLVVEQLDNFYNYLQFERRLSDHTLASYQTQLQAIFRDCFDLTLAELDITFVRQMLSQSKSENLKPASINLRLSSLRTFCQYLVKHNLLKLNPAKAIMAPKMDKRLPKNLDIDQVQQLLDGSNNEGKLNLRDNVMLELMYSSGLRLAELIGSNIDDINWDNKIIRVMGKGKKTRDLPVTNIALDKINRWLSLRAEFVKADTDNALFISSRGRRLSPRYVRERIKLAGIKNGLDVHLNPHKIRHTFATHMLEGSQDLRAVQELLGHQNLSTTQVYTHLDFEHLAKVYDQTHPRAKK